MTKFKQEKVSQLAVFHPNVGNLCGFSLSVGKVLKKTSEFVGKTF